MREGLTMRVRTGLIAAAMLLGAAVVLPAHRVDGAELRTMSAADIRALQQRLIDAKCYAGPIDGTASQATEAALKKCPVMDPILSIETGMHTAPIRRIGAD